MPSSNYLRKTHQSQRGVSLVEVLLASMLGIIVLLGTTKIFKHLSNNSQIQLSQNSLQNTADMALSHFSNRLQNALTMPCGFLQHLQKTGAIKIHNLIGGKGHKTLTNKHEVMINQLINGIGMRVTQKNITIAEQQWHTDDLTFITAKEHFLVDKIINKSTNTLYFNNHFSTEPKGDAWLAKGYAQPFLITDCQQSEVFLAQIGYRKAQGYSDLQLQILNETELSSYPKNKLVMVSPLNATILSIDEKYNLNDKMIFDQNIGNTLMNDVLLMRLIFGIDSVGNDGITDKYITAAQLTSQTPPSKITSIRVNLLVQVPSFQKSLNTPESYSVELPDTTKPIPGSGKIPVQTLTFKDRILRKVFSRTITLRN